ncbi:MAG: hypothetical protein FJ253_05725 [Phycisphaerae bacterium]|nr:hypothetical protein [Phycisphaerae bacterium]
MPTPIRAIEPRHLAVRCVACGLSMRDPSADRCPRCGIDLGERPPRSYAEMEGLLETTERPVVLRRAGWQERRLVERWIMVGFLSAMVIVAVIGIVLAVERG